MKRGEVGGGARYPLRRQHLDAFLDLVSVKGVRPVARAVGTSVEEIEEIKGGRFPSTFTRQRIIEHLVAAGLSKHRGSDPFRPDGTEAILSSREKSALQDIGELPQ